MSTVPELVIEEVRSPSTLSVAVAPGSVKVSPTDSSITIEPIKVITGAVVSGGVFTTTSLSTKAELSELSITE